MNSTYKILPATTGELKVVDEAITDFNIEVVPALPWAEIHRLDFVCKNQTCPSGEPA